jgi:hypothetical protein
MPLDDPVQDLDITTVRHKNVQAISLAEPLLVEILGHREPRSEQADLLKPGFPDLFPR